VGAAAKILLSTEFVYGSLTPPQGIEALEAIMSLQETQIGVSGISDVRLLQSMCGQGRYLDEMMPTEEAVNRTEENDTNLIQKIRSASGRKERREKVRLYIEHVIKKTLNLSPNEVLDPEQNYSDMGVDSLMEMEMRNRFQNLVGDRPLSLRLMQEKRTIRALSSQLEELMES
jgi:hypothetical protein